MALACLCWSPPVLGRGQRFEPGLGGGGGKGQRPPPPAFPLPFAQGTAGWPQVFFSFSFLRAFLHGASDGLMRLFTQPSLRLFLAQPPSFLSHLPSPAPCWQHPQYQLSWWWLFQCSCAPLTPLATAPLPGGLGPLTLGVSIKLQERGFYWPDIWSFVPACTRGLLHSFLLV